MRKYNLIKYLKILGLSTVSALTYQNDVISLIADDSNVLYEYNTKYDELNKITLSEGELENLSKADKLDFESMVDSDKSMYIFGSGSIEFELFIRFDEEFCRNF